MTVCVCAISSLHSGSLEGREDLILGRAACSPKQPKLTKI